MAEERKVLGLVPARGGSKGIVRKNLFKLAGKPLIYYTIDAANKSKIFTDLWVSSEDKEIADYSNFLGAKTIARPIELATDLAAAADVVSHFIQQIDCQNKHENITIIYLQPTSPLRTEKHIRESYELHRKTKMPVISVVELDKSPYKSFALDENGCLRALFDEKLSNARRQDLPRAFVPNGAIYIFTIGQFLARGGFPSEGAVPYFMSAAESVDIDGISDMELAEVNLRRKKNG